MTRTVKTPRQRAEEQLAVADRLVKKHAGQKTKHAARLATATAAHDAAVVRRDWLRQHPDLQPPATSTGATR